MRLLILSLLLLGGSAVAQDAGQQAAQMASDAAMQASQAAMQATQVANQAASQATAQAQQNALLTGVDLGCLTRKPKISVENGTYSQPLRVVLTDRTRNALIFYTTDGWKPTLLSPRFDGPITIDRTTHLQVVAYAPGCSASDIVDAMYTFQGTVMPTAVAGDSQGVLHAGTAVPLQFAAAVDSKHAQVGQVLELATAVPVTIDGRTFPAGSVSAQAVVTAVHRGSWVGTPADLSFAVQGMTLAGSTVPLKAERTAEPLAVRTDGGWGWAKNSTAEAHGRDLVIPAGAAVTATVSADTHVNSK